MQSAVQTFSCDTSFVFTQAKWLRTLVSAGFGGCCVGIAGVQAITAEHRGADMAETRKVPAATAAEIIAAGYTYLDVRTPEEYAAGRPPGSVNIPFMLKTEDGLKPNTAFLQAVKSKFPEATAQLVVGCKAGNRSAKACLMLLQQGSYTNLVDNTGGFDGWMAADLPVDT